MDSVTMIAIVIALAYVILYIQNRVYLSDGFQDKDANKAVARPRNVRTVLDTSDQTRPYVTYEDKQGDFEQDFIYQHEGGRNPSKDAINAARRAFPFDWSQLPPSSSLYQAQQAMFTKEGAPAPFTKKTYENIDAEHVLPPDVETEERKLNETLSQYHSNAQIGMKSIDDTSVEQMLHNIYGEKGLIPRIAKKANNVYEVYETIEKNPKIVWEDDVQVQASAQDNALEPLPLPTEQLLTVPAAVGDVTVGLAPRATGEVVRPERQTYGDRNPNLEGVFGPSMNWQQWG